MGKRVIISGLGSRPALNGRVGLALQYVADKDRLAVRIDGEHILLKVANLGDAVSPYIARQGALRTRLSAARSSVDDSDNLDETSDATREAREEDLKEAEALMAMLPDVDDNVPSAKVTKMAVYRASLGLSFKTFSDIKLCAEMQLRDARVNLAEYLEKNDQFADAQPLHDSNAASMKIAMNEVFYDCVEVAKALNNAGLCRKHRGHFDEALALYREAIDVCESREARLTASNPKALQAIRDVLEHNVAAVRDLLSQHVKPNRGANHVGGEQEAKAAMTSATGAEGFPPVQGGGEC